MLAMCCVVACLVLLLLCGLFLLVLFLSDNDRKLMVEGIFAQLLSVVPHAVFNLGTCHTMEIESLIALAPHDDSDLFDLDSLKARCFGVV